MTAPSASHISELTVDRLLARELSADAAAAARAHAADCLPCGALLADALAARDEFAARRPPLALPRRRAVPAVTAAAMAFAAALAIVLTWPRDHGDSSGTRAKGGAILGAFVAHGADVRLAGRREPVVPGDRIELFTTTSEAGYFAAIAVDGRGARSVFVAPRAIAAGRAQVIPTAIELDDALGVSTVTGVFCAAPFEPAVIDLAAPPPGCTADRLELVVTAP